MKQIQIQNLDIISKLYPLKKNHNYKNCLLLPSFYFIKSSKGINYINKLQLKENIFSANISDKYKKKYLFKFNASYFKAINLSDIEKEYSKYYILEDILHEVEFVDNEIFQINDTFLIYKNEEFVEIPAEYVDNEVLEDIPVENIKIEKFNKHSVSKNDLFLKNIFKENYKEIMLKYIDYVSITALSFSVYFINNGVQKNIFNEKIELNISKNNLKNNISYLKNIKKEISYYKEDLDKNFKYINNIIIKKNWKELNINLQKKKFSKKEI